MSQNGVKKYIFETTSSGETVDLHWCLLYDLNDLRILNGIQLGFLVFVAENENVMTRKNGDPETSKGSRGHDLSE